MPRGLVLTLIAVHGLAVAALIAAVGWTHPKPRPCRATFEQVQMGMTRAEVIATVGPPGSYLSPNVAPFPMSGGGGVFPTWLSDDATLEVGFDDADTAYDVVVTPSQRIVFPTRWDLLREWVTTGYEPRLLQVRRVGRYDLGTLWRILDP